MKKNYKAYLLIGYAFLLLVHFVFKDYIYPVSVIYYCFPTPILIGIGLVLAILSFRKKLYFSVISLVVLLVVFHWFNAYYYTNPTDENAKSKILFWNVAKEEFFPIDIIIQEVKQSQPQILAFVEAKYLTENEVNTLSKALPEYEFKDLYSHMLVGIKGNIIDDKLYSVEKSHEVYLINSFINNKTVNLIIADVYAYPFIDKKPPLHRILEIAKQNEVSIIVGDFNTPYESVHFHNYFKYYKSFHSYCNGFTATWPLSIPLFEIDHVWISNKFTPVSIEKKYFSVSDHALLIAEFY
ncbi:MAG: endonuclease/exonuclease/phosphatase family protein [Algicola sp.]|nr:endonuclease/exonuclease/phosphatase family protein [Algicola sp.]